MTDGLTAETTTFTGADGDPVEAYLARPASELSRGGVVVIHHLPGYDRATKEMTRRIAELGYDAVCPNLYWREAPGAEPSDAAAIARRQGGVPDERLIEDVAGAARFLRGLESSNGKAGVMGFCSGGRQSVLAACHLDLDAAVDCYGAFITGTPGPDHPLQVRNLVADLPDLRCALLGLFGSQDSAPNPVDVDELERLLRSGDKEFELHRYDNAGHAFLATDRPSYRVEAANDAWEHIAAFFDRHLGQA